MDRQFESHASAMRVYVRSLNVATMFFDDAVTDAQPQAGAFAHGLGGIERIEGAAGVGEAGHSVFKAQYDAISAELSLYADSLLADAFQSVDGIVEEVDEDLLE